ncbi:hypothetical protein [Azospirillum largimobile]
MFQTKPFRKKNFGWPDHNRSTDVAARLPFPLRSLRFGRRGSSFRFMTQIYFVTPT